ncbi:Hypothetical predicted protein [Paramuricea clavata]|uniref:Uncharacterized protein n=1 Tax=Paramuricea clavata TaxID=317549 RepID=A0A6S7JNZ8_PARCT|nr:Hypothetical predicted protein [Paramuricea clavata]
MALKKDQWHGSFERKSVSGYEKDCLRKEHKRWVWAYRRDRLLVTVNTDNGIERQNLAFKYDYLVDWHRASTLSTMLTILVEEFIPESYDRYVENNAKSSSQYRQYNQTIPRYLHNRPPCVVDHCMERLQFAYDIKDECVKIVDQQRFLFLVKSQDINRPDLWYNVSFGIETMPSCGIGKEIDFLANTFWLYFHITLIVDLISYLQSIKIRHFLLWTKMWSFEAKPFLVSKRSKAKKKWNCQKYLQFVNVIRQSSINWNAKCKEGVKQITLLLHVVDDNDALKDAYSLVTSCIEVLNRATNKEEGLIFEKGGESSKTHGQKKYLQTKHFKDLPKPRRKGKTSCHVGIKAEELKRNLTIQDIADQEDQTPKKKCCTVIETEIAPLDLSHKNKI